MNLPFPVAIYARYSTDRQDARSIDDQIRRCRAFAVERGYTVAAEYSDAAVSGAHLERADMQRMLAAARQRGGFKAVLVDDLSRLSRDLGATWRIVFEDLASVDVKVVDVTTGLASDGAGARLTFGAMALVNDTFLQLVRTETHRGLQGRALGGFWTGGRVYGYGTVEEENPPDPEHRRKRPVIHEAEAEIVRRIFRLFADGMTLKQIAAMLNTEGVPAPHDGGKGNKHGRGWGHTTIRAMLLNERYLGRLIWNQSKWVRVPGKKSRRRVMRPEAERIVTKAPELAIIGRDMWDVVQARFSAERRRGRRGRPPATGSATYLVSGLMRCGTCGGSLTIRAIRKKAGIRYARFGCTTHFSRGPSVCQNSLTVSERAAARAIVGAIEDLMKEPRVIGAFVAGFEARLNERNAERRPDTAQLDRRLRETGIRVRNATDALARLGWSDALGEQLRAEEQKLLALKAERARAASGRITAPPPEQIAAYLRDLLTIFDADPKRGRALLARHLAPIIMTPQGSGPGRHYRATGALNLSVCLSNLAAGAASGAGDEFAKCGSGGEI